MSTPYFLLSQGGRKYTIGFRMGSLMITDLGQRQIFQSWLDFLSSVKNDSKNQDHLLNYFFDRFLESPENFYRFIVFFEKFLRRSRGETRAQLANHYLKALSLLCDRGGFFAEKKRLDELCFSIVLPDEYKKILEAVSDYRRNSCEIIERICSVLYELIAEKHFDVTVTGRQKNLYSAYRKMWKFGFHRPLAVNDLFGFRIIVLNNSIDDCFEILNLLHDRFYPVADCFKDFITIPKINGYQSLHTGLLRVIPEFGLPIEAQIRTAAMHEFSEHGTASHWLYAREKKSALLTDKEKQLLDYFSHFSHFGSGVSSPKLKSSVYFFSYTGDLFRMQAGSSVLDFAYFLHSELGGAAEYAEVNGKSAPLDYIIREGDHVKIIKKYGKK